MRPRRYQRYTERKPRATDRRHAVLGAYEAFQIDVRKQGFREDVEAA
jgi:hypothetical protein